MASSNAQFIELKHARNHEEPKYIALEDLNFAWLEEEIVTVIQMWSEGRPIWDISKMGWKNLRDKNGHWEDVCPGCANS